MSNKKLVKTLGFTPKEGVSGIYIKKYSKANNYAVEVDFENKQFNYGKLITSESKTTQNFSQAENWVVLECIDRLLEKGYKPKNITLEKTWATGHGTSGRLDILVTNDSSKAFLMIECKTAGTEFTKELNKTLKDGGQLFTYFQQDRGADFLMLYTSELKNNEIFYKNEIIKIEDDYREASNVEDLFERWNRLTKDNGIFDSWAKPYHFESKALTPESLVDITEDASKKIFIRFLEILRHNVVSDKPNAFNKIFTLFLCKIYDEWYTKPGDELQFQWLEGRDNHITFQKRLTDLYRNGMKQFLEKEVTDLSDSDFETKYKHLNEDDRRQILETLTELRLKKNNEFAIKEVFDNDSFDENAKVVKDVVELLQTYKIRYTKKQQYLSDFFELLLTTGLKQESGQFFTPVPVAQFIVRSLPIDKMIKEKLEKGSSGDLLPTVIDYAAGSGHFLTESMHVMQEIIDSIDESQYIRDTTKKIDNWKRDHFDWAYDYVYGVEKDYRLVKVGKVGCYLHGDGLAKVVHSDGLGSFSGTKEYKEKLKLSSKDFPQENCQFDIVVSNPPYSVKAFKPNASKYYSQNDFALYDFLTDQSSEIECLFIERTKQLLKDGGMAGVILPSSILSNGGIYTKTREIILKYFEIIGITELGSNTFMATGTNTVTLFLRRRNNYDSINIEKAIDTFSINLQDVTINGIEKPVKKYVSQIWEDLTFDDYKSIFQKDPNSTVKSHEIYKEYIKKSKQKDDALLDTIIELEKEKILYFILTYGQTVVLVKSGEKKAEKAFLGYEFSNRRGSEGIHPIQRGKSIDECTKLYDTETFENPEKVSTYIYDAYTGNYSRNIDDNLKENIRRVDLVNMMTFDRVDFDKSMNLVVKKKINSRWQIVTLGDVCDVRDGTHESPEFTNKGYPLVTSKNITNGYLDLNNVKFISKKDYNNINKRSIVEKGDILYAMIGTIGSPLLVDIEPEFAIKNVALFKFAKNNKLINRYVKELLDFEIVKNQIQLEIKGSNRKFVSLSILRNLKIPLPPKGIQEEIVAGIAILEGQEKKAKENIEKLNNRIVNIVKEQYADSKLLKRIKEISVNTQYGSSKALNEYKEGYKTFRMNEIIKGKMTDSGSMKYSEISEDEFLKYKLEKNDILFNRTNSIELVGKTGIFNLAGNYMFASYLIRLKIDETKAYPVYVNTIMNSETFLTEARSYATKAVKQANINAEKLKNLSIPIPSLSKQKEIVKKIEEADTKISKLEIKIAEIPAKKEAILKKYL